MIRSMVALFMLAILISCMPDKDINRLSEQINAELAKFQGTFAVAFKDLETGKELLINERERYHAASTMKTPVMIEVFKQAAEGRFALTDSMPLRNEFKSIVDGSSFSLNPADDGDQELYQQIGGKRTIRDLVYDMIIVSSNLATNIVIDLVDPKLVTKTMRQLGARDIQVLRGVEDSKAFEKGLNNTTTAYDLMLIFEKLAQEDLVNEESSKAMISILMDQKFKDVIPARLPANVKVAHKTGNITGIQHDSGIVFLPDGRKYVVVLLSKNLADEKSGKEALARVSEMIYQFVSSTP